MPKDRGLVFKKQRNYCFVCGESNREGLRLVFQYDPEVKKTTCIVRIPSRYQGATGFAHGGIIATLLDEAMAKVNGKGGIRAVTLRMTVKFRKMVPVKTPLDLVGQRVARKGRKIYLRSELRAGSTLLAEAKGLFLEVARV